MHEFSFATYLIALLVGVVAGMRSMMAPAVVSWASYLGRLRLAGTAFAFLGVYWVHWVLTVFALGELVGDQIPSTPSRTAPLPFGFRIVSGAACGAAICVAGGSMIGGGMAGAVGAVLGTLGGHAVRARLAEKFRADRPAAFIEDAVALVSAVLILLALQ